MPTPHETPQQQLRHAYLDALQRPIMHPTPSTPPLALDVIPEVETPQETLWHPVKAVTDILDKLSKLQSSLERIHNSLELNRTFYDVIEQIGATVGYQVNYARYHCQLLYVYVNSNITLNYSTGGSVSITANTWTNITPPKGTIIVVQGGSDVTLSTLYLRYTNTAMS